MKGYEAGILEAGFSHYMTKPIDIDALSKLLADLLGGKRVESKVPTASLNIVKTSDDNQTHTGEGQFPIYSRLAGSDKLAPVIEKFIVRVHEQFGVMKNAHQQNDLEELAGLAHWLKGSGGTIGFDQLSIPAKSLEDNAKAGEADACKSDLKEIESIIERLRAGTRPASDAVREPGAQDSHIQAVEVVESSLLAKNPTFRPIVMKFIPRLNAQIEAMDRAIENQDHDELAALAHWLKGSGGTVGFDVFTKPAAAMETGAKSNNMDVVNKNLTLIKQYAEKIVVQGNDDTNFEQSA